MSDFDYNDFIPEYEEEKNRFYIDLRKITNQHLINRLRYFRRMLADNPGEQYYMGNSEYAEDAVECENMHNEILAEEIKEHIEELKAECKQRGIV